MVVDPVFLLEGLFMLLVDHDQAEAGERQKQRGARAHHDFRVPGGDRAPKAVLAR